MRVSSTGDSVTFRFQSDEVSRELYPFDFLLDITSRLNGNKIEVIWDVTIPNY